MDRERLQQIADEAVSGLWDCGIFTRKEIKEFSEWLDDQIELEFEK